MFAAFNLGHAIARPGSKLLLLPVPIPLPAPPRVKAAKACKASPPKPARS